MDRPLIDIPQFLIMRKIGNGANGTVYEARDKILGRMVALKIWNARGRSRARLEAAKIAGLNHPLVVTTHEFGIADGHPYAIMELVPGSSGKAWMHSKPPLKGRLDVWGMYARALRHLHSLGTVHGDPHLGNLIVFNDASEAFAPRDWEGKPSLAMKLADAGTSKFWLKSGDFAAREAKLIVETAKRIFALERFDALADGLAGSAYQEILENCDAIVSCISTLNGLPDSYAYSLVADAVVEIVMRTPLFNLDELHRQVSRSEMTQVHRVITRLNGELLGYSKSTRHNGGAIITEETHRLYAVWREQWRSGKRMPPLRR